MAHDLGPLSHDFGLLCGLCLLGYLALQVTQLLDFATPWNLSETCVPFKCFGARAASQASQKSDLPQSGLPILVWDVG